MQNNLAKEKFLDGLLLVAHFFNLQSKKSFTGRNGKDLHLQKALLVVHLHKLHPL